VWVHEIPDILFPPQVIFLAALRPPCPEFVTERYLSMIDSDPVGALWLRSPADVQI
jgi:hypothetical protein